MRNAFVSCQQANAWVYPNINDGVYRCGFAKSQQAYDTAFENLFEALDKAEILLGTQRYIAGDVFTEADVRLFVTLIRFDEVRNPRRILRPPYLISVDLLYVRMYVFCLPIEICTY